ncbi:MAG: DUF4384 domain-containing protein [Thermodesulfobacteriota bacterium]
MKFFKLWGLPLLLVAFCMMLLTTPRARAVQKEEKNVCFRWAFGAMVGQENDRRLVAITRDTTLKTGDKLKLLVELQKECFVYVIYHSEQDGALMLFPYELEQFTTDYKTSKRYLIPQGDRWFELDEHVGLEKFYLMASATRLTELEALFKKQKSPSTVNKQERAEQILAQIRKIKRRHRTLTTNAERPVLIGGNVRGNSKDAKAGSPDFDAIAAEVSAHNFYSRTFTIEHQ